MSIYICSLFSGSGGNCYVVGNGEANFLVDAGVSARRIECALGGVGLSFDDISAIFITHEHIDHVKGLEIIEKRHHIPVYMTEGTARAFIFDANSPILPNLYAYRNNFSVELRGFTVRSFSVPHDAAQPVGYIFEKDGDRVGIATDTGCVTDEMIENLVGCRAAVIEANHDVTALKMGPYPTYLKERIASDRGHLSNTNAARLAKMLVDGGAEALMLGHISKENNSPSLALEEVRAAIGDDALIVAAAPDKTTELKNFVKIIDIS
ncbi:MAG: MBL fold metallo-hydrolase [Clostridia bacterium]|nr:MBL fold metallo-hydrolase [Clostridia bacterium]